MFALLIASNLSPLLPLTVGFRKRFTLLWLYVITGLFFDLVILFLRRVAEAPFYWAADVYVLLEFVLVSWLFSSLFKNKKAHIACVFLLAFFFCVSTLSEPLDHFNTFGASFFSFAYILYALTGFYSILKRQEVVFLERSSFFWVNIAFLVYASGNLMLFLFNDYLRAYNNELFVALWRSFFLVLIILKNIFLAFALSPKVVDK